MQSSVFGKETGSQLFLVLSFNPDYASDVHTKIKWKKATYLFSTLTQLKFTRIEVASSLT